MGDKTYTLLLVEDDETLGYLLHEYLQMKGFLIKWSKNGKKALEELKAHVFDLAILDVMMPEMDGYSLAVKIKQVAPELPFIFLTAKSLKIDVLKGFALGAVDYLKKPLDEEELVVRIERLLTRLVPEMQMTTDNHILRFAQCELNFLNQELSIAGETRHLTSRECELLKYLVQHRNKLCSHKEILHTIWGRNDYFNQKSLNVFITKLRQFLKNDTALKIENIHGKGFIFRVNE